MSLIPVSKVPVSQQPLLARVSQDELYGVTPPPLIDCDGFMMRQATAAAFVAMQQAAKADGVTIGITSAYRSFERQLAIWNAKAQGKRPLLDAQSNVLDATNLDESALVDAILLWSALPGCSRHHLGTDLDVFAPDLVSRETLKLESWEYAKGGPCHALSCWLDDNAARFGFFRPYQAGKSGVSPEPWHISFAPEAERLLADFDVRELRLRLGDAPLTAKEAVLTRLDALVDRYVHFYAKPSFLLDDVK